MVGNFVVPRLSSERIMYNNNSLRNAKMVSPLLLSISAHIICGWFSFPVCAHRQPARLCPDTSQPMVFERGSGGALQTRRDQSQPQSELLRPSSIFCLTFCSFSYTEYFVSGNSRTLSIYHLYDALTESSTAPFKAFSLHNFVTHINFLFLRVYLSFFPDSF